MSVGPYEIQTGDNLSHIATSAGMNEEELEAANPDRPIKTWWRRPILWNEAGAIVWIEGYSNGDGGTGTPGPPGPPGPEGPQGPPGTGGDFDGEHVLTGDPDSPPEGWAAGQLLYDGLQDAAGDAGPHDHDYLPLAGGTLTGGLTVEDRLTLASETSNPLMLVNSGETRVGYFGVPGAQAGIDGELHLRSDKALILQGVDGVRLLQSDLQVDGTIIVKSGGGATNAAIGFNGLDGMGIYSSVQNNYMRFGVSGAQRLAIKETEVVVNNNLQVDGQIKATDGGSKDAPAFQIGPDKAMGMFGSIASQWIRFATDGEYRFQIGTTKATAYGDLQVNGAVQVPNARTDPSTNAPNLYVNTSGTVKHTTFQAAPKTFNIADGIDTRDVLERAETATMPALDEEGVATTDVDVESLTVNEVVTALLAKVKELSAEIEELKTVFQKPKGA
jgi:hypothetical protein